MKEKYFVIFYHFRQASNLSNALIVTENWHQSKFIFIQSTIHVFSIVNQINPTSTVEYNLMLDLIRGVLKLQKSLINSRCKTHFFSKRYSYAHKHLSRTIYSFSYAWFFRTTMSCPVLASRYHILILTFH